MQFWWWGESELQCTAATMTRWLLAIALLVLSPFRAVASPRFTAPSGPILPHPTITGEAENNLDLSQGPELSDLAARSLSRIHVELEGEQQTVIVEEEVNVNIDCLPFQSSLPGGSEESTEWFFQPRDINGNLATGKKICHVMCTGWIPDFYEEKCLSIASCSTILLAKGGKC